MVNKKPKSCWSFWNCPKDIRKKCPAYTADLNKEYIYPTHDFRARVKRDFDFCVECPWYKKNTPNINKGKTYDYY